MACPPCKGGGISALSEVSCTSLSKMKDYLSKETISRNPVGDSRCRDKSISFQAFVCPLLLWPKHGTLINLSLQAVYLGDVFFLSSINLEDKTIKLQ